MMNIKQIKSVLIKIWAIVFLVLFSTWLIGGCIYNSIGKESIQEDIQQLKQELYSIKPIQNYFVKNVALANSCLLYTSPSPRDGLLSRMPSSA